MSSYDAIVPVGRGCTAAMLLVEARLRRFSLPFDWLGRCTPDTVARLLHNDFSTFLCRDSLVLNVERSRIDRLWVVEDVLNDLLFAHDFHDRDLSNFDAVKQKYQRRIERLYSLQSCARLLFFYVGPTGDWTQAEASIRAQFSRSYTDFLYINKGANMREALRDITVALTPRERLQYIIHTHQHKTHDTNRIYPDPDV